MKFSTLTLIAAAIVGSAQAASSDEQVVGSFVFMRHGDRLAKRTKKEQKKSKGIEEGTTLTPLGVQEVHEAGEFMHDRYFNSSSPYHIEALNETYQHSQIYAQVPNDVVLQKSHVGFLQGFYPPLSEIDVSDTTLAGASLNNGSTTDNPLGGYQYVMHVGSEPETPDDIWIEGASSCKAFTKASKSYLNSTEFKHLNESTLDFYQKLYPLLSWGLEKSELQYGNAYGVYDFMNVNYIHNETFYKQVSKDHKEDFDQVRFLSDQYSKNVNFNSKDSNAMIGGQALAGSILSQLNETKTAGSPLVTYYTGAYSIIYQLFGALGLYDENDAQFTGIVDYASLLAFELVKKGDDYNVRFSLRNGTFDAKMESYPILGSSSDLMPYDDFVSKLGKVAIKDLSTWCGTCGSWDLDMCIPYSKQYLAAKADGFDVKESSSLSLAGAGGIGAGVTLGVVAIAGALAWLLFGRKKAVASSSNSFTDVESGYPVTKEHSASQHSASTRH